MTNRRMIQGLAITAMVLSLGDRAAAQPAGSGAKPATPSQSTDTLPDPVLIKRWASLTKDLLEDFKQDNRSPIANIEADFSTLEIKVRLTSTRDDAWVKRTFSAAKLQDADIQATVKALYDEAKRKL